MTKVDIDGYQVHANLILGDDPPVLGVSAMGTDSAQWHPVIDRLTTATTVITYDRPGIGLSPQRPGPSTARSYRTFADEVATMLDRLGVDAPVVAAGHSFGSLIIRSLAARHPDRIAGMVHVDGSTPVIALWPNYRPLLDGQGSQATPIDAAAGAAELADATVPPVPVVVITRTPGRWDPDHRDPAIDRSWRDHQADLARHCRAPLVVAVNSGHDIPGEAPDLVAFAVDEVVRAVRRGHPRVTLDPFQVHAAGGELRTA